MRSRIPYKQPHSITVASRLLVLQVLCSAPWWEIGAGMGSSLILEGKGMLF